MNSLPKEFLQDNPLGKLPLDGDVAFEKLVSKQGVVFQKGLGTSVVYYLMHREDKLIFESFQELLKQAVEIANMQLRGLYGLQVLSYDLTQKWDSFQPTNLAQLIVNHGRTLEVGGQSVIQYGSVWFVLHKRVDEDWGKLDLNIPMEIYTKEIEKFDLYLKKVIKMVRETVGNEPLAFLLQDFSKKPLFRFGQEEQTERLSLFFSKEIANLDALKQLIYYCHEGAVVDLKEQFRTIKTT